MYFLNRNKQIERDRYVPRHCPTATSESLSAYADGMLDGAELRIVDAHIAHCGECSLALREITQQRAMLRGVRNSSVRADETYWRQVYRLARQQRGAPHASAPPLRLTAALGVAGCLVALAAFSIPLAQRHGASQQAQANSGSTKLYRKMHRLPIASVPGELSINALVESHARMVSEQSPEDHARATFAVSDLTARASGEGAPPPPPPSLQESTLQNASATGSRSVVIAD